MESFIEHKTNIETFTNEADVLKTKIYNALVSYIDELTPGHSEGNIYPMGRGTSMTLKKSLFDLSHIYYNKKEDNYQFHLENCMNSTPVLNYPLEDILQVYKQLYYVDKDNIF